MTEEFRKYVIPFSRTHTCGALGKQHAGGKVVLMGWVARVRNLGGLRFVETAHVKDLVALLRFVENPSYQMAWFRVLQLLEGVGPVTAGPDIEHAQVLGGAID